MEYLYCAVYVIILLNLYPSNNDQNPTCFFFVDPSFKFFTVASRFRFQWAHLLRSALLWKRLPSWAVSVFAMTACPAQAVLGKRRLPVLMVRSVPHQSSVINQQSSNEVQCVRMTHLHKKDDKRITSTIIRKFKHPTINNQQWTNNKQQSPTNNDQTTTDNQQSCN